MKKITLFFSAVLCSSLALSQVQSNNCRTSGAGELTVNSTCTYEIFNSTNNSDYWDGATGCSATDRDDAWGWFTATATSTTITFDPNANNRNPIITLFTGLCDPSMTALACVNDGGNGVTETLTYATNIGQTYMVRLQHFDGDNNMEGRICVFSPPAAPANDEPCGAIDLTIAGSCSYATYSNVSSTGTVGPPAPGCASYVTGDVWFRVQVPANGSIEIDTDDIDFTDGGMAAYSGTCGSLSLLSCNDDGSANGLMPLISLTGLTPGDFIYIRVWEYGGNEFGDFGICVTSPTPPPPPVLPPNDECADAIVAPVNPDALCTNTVSGSIAGATASAQANACFGTADDDVWYSFTATSTEHTLSLLNVTGSTTDLYHSVYSGTCGSIGAPILCSDPESSTLTGLTIGNTYYIRIYSWTSLTGQTSTFDLCIGTPPPPPTNITCGLMAPICSGSPIAFTAASGGGSAEPGNDYDCLFTQPNPSWYYLEISNPGDLIIDITAGSDVDYALWGPYVDLAEAQATCGSHGLPVDCSYSASPIEQAVVTGVVTGEVYVLLVTNYADIVQTIFVNEAAANTAATDCSIVPLPVELVTFTVDKTAHSNVLNWSTATERENHYFSIQRSDDGFVWETIGIVEGNGTTNQTSYYSYDDESIVNGITYYRLKQVDYDGQFSYSMIRSVSRLSEQEKTTVYPMPNNGAFSVSSSQEIKRMNITDLAGRTIEFSAQVITDLNYSVKLSSVSSGMYNLEIVYADDRTEALKFIVE